MNELSINPTTGYLDADNINAFGSDKKLRFFELCKDHREKTGKWPDFSSVCDAIGIGARTLDRHLRIDEKFADEFKELTLRGKYKLESQMFDLAGKNPLYMLAWLRKWFPNEYDPARQVQVTHQLGTLTRLIDEAKAQSPQVIEGEIVDK